MAGAALSSFPDTVTSYKGLSDAYLEVIASGSNFGGQIFLNDLELFYTDFSSIDLKWGRPTNFPNIVNVTYSLMVKDPITKEEHSLLDNYIGTSFTVSSQPFDKYYRYRAFWGGNSVFSSYTYAARVMLLTPQLGAGTALISANLAASKVYALYEEGTERNMTVATLSVQNGNIIAENSVAVVNTAPRLFFPFTGTSWIAGGGSGVQQITSAPTYLLKETSSKITSITPGSNNTVWTAGLASQGANWILTLGHYSSNDTLSTGEYSAILCTGATGNVFAREHTARASLFVFMACYNYLSLVIIPFTDWDVNTSSIDASEVLLNQTSFLPADSCTGISVDEQNDLVYLTMLGEGVFFRMDTYHIASKQLTRGQSVALYPTVNTIPMAQAHTVGAGFWHPEAVGGEGGYQIDLYYWDLLGTPVILQSIPVSGSSVLSVSSITTMADGTIALAGYGSGGVLGSETTLFSLFVDDIPLPTTITFVPSSTSISFSWAPPAGIKSEYLPSLYYQLVRLDAGGQQTEAYTGAATNANHTGLSPSTQYTYQLTAFYNTVDYVVYPNISVNTQPRSLTINEFQLNSLSPSTLTAFDSSNSRIFMLAEDTLFLFDAVTLANVNQKQFDFSPYAGLHLSDMKVDNQGNLLIVGYSVDEDSTSVLFNIDSSLNLFLNSYDISAVYPDFTYFAWSNLVILPNNDIWTCGLAGPPGYTSIVIAIVSPSNSTPTYLLWNKNTNEEAVAIEYNHDNNLVYIFGRPQDSFDSFFVYILTVNVTTHKITYYEWTPNVSPSSAFLLQLVYDTYLHKLYAGTAEASPGKKRMVDGQTAYAIQHFSLDSNGAIVSAHETRTTMGIDLISAVPPFSGDFGSGIVGVTSVALPGNTQNDVTDIFDGTETGPFFYQFSGTYVGLRSLNFFSDERTLNKYYLALEIDGSINAYAYLRAVLADPIDGNISITIFGISDKSVTFSLNKPSNIPNLSYVRYSISCYANGVANYTHTLHSPDPTPNYTCPFVPQQANYRIGVTTIYGGVATQDVQLYPAIPPIQFTNITNTSVTITVGYVPTSFPYTIQISNTSSFAIILQTLPPGNQTVTGLVKGKTYYFRIVMNSIQGIYFYYETVNFTIGGLPCSNVYCACSANQIRCQNGSCVDSLAQCVVRPSVVCPTSRSFLCANQTCVSSHKECALGAVACLGTSCWDGSCVTSASACSIVPACPVLTIRCPDGTCANSSVQCPISPCASSQLCQDGSCSPCFNAYGCPATLPLLCPNGKCVHNESECRTNCSDTTYQCYDETCQSDPTLCATPPRLNYPVPFSYILPQQNSTNSKTLLPVEIIDANLGQIAQIFLPFSLFTYASSAFSDVLDVMPVPDSAMYGVNGSDLWGNTGYSENLLSTVLSLVIEGYNTQETEFSALVKIDFNNSLPPNTNLSRLCLGFINRTANEWQCESLVQVIDGILHGNTSHFTEFAVLVGDIKAPHVNTLDSDDFGRLRDIDKSTISAYVLAGIVFLYLCGLFFTIRVDRKRAMYAAMGMPGSRPQSIALTDISATVTDGESPSSTPTAGTPIFTRSKEGTIHDEKGKRLGFRELILSRLRIKHSWIAVARAPLVYQLTRTNILTLLLCMILGNLLISAAFYNYTDDTGIAQRIITGIIVALIVFPMTLILGLIFRFTPRRFSYIPYIIAFLYCSVCIIITLVYTLKFGDRKAKAWLVSIAISTGQDGIINQPIKLILSSLVIILFPTSWLATIML
eukprot:Phypoly_transcript_00222.p1 GENE.Phypoly_transcript_00222~~Phypoly_transcript_00222.p1  ORF type:complete len:1913 (+),score=199.97 Phypoly_transcript_00222:539-5740(+)